MILTAGGVSTEEVRDIKMQQHFALDGPGWYGIANVKWLERIDVLGNRYKNRFMARDYVTIRYQPGSSPTNRVGLGQPGTSSKITNPLTATKGLQNS